MYTEIIHIGEGKFNVMMEDGSSKEAGPNIRGMIRYTYFEDYTIPPLDWAVKREIFLQDYQKKVMPEILSGKIKPGKHNF